MIQSLLIDLAWLRQAIMCAFGKHDPELRHVFYMWRDEPYIEKHCKHCDRELKNV